MIVMITFITHSSINIYLQYIAAKQYSYAPAHSSYHANERMWTHLCRKTNYCSGHMFVALKWHFAASVYTVNQTNTVHFLVSFSVSSLYHVY